VLRGEAVVILDPKGDQGLRAAAERACALAGTRSASSHFHPAFPAEASVRIDPLRSFQRATELASRVAALIPSGDRQRSLQGVRADGAQPCVHGLLAVEERPTLVTLRRYLEGGAESLVERVLQRYFDSHLPHWQEQAGPTSPRRAMPIDARGGCCASTASACAPPSLDRGRRTRRPARARGVHFGKMIASSCR
jgi:conjugal transfer pilus assembly protein TraD